MQSKEIHSLWNLKKIVVVRIYTDAIYVRVKRQDQPNSVE